MPPGYFGAQATLSGLRPLPARGESPRAVVVSSTAALSPYDPALVEACLAGDEDRALALAITAEDGRRALKAAKRALARWLRRVAVTDE